MERAGDGSEHFTLAFTSKFKNIYENIKKKFNKKSFLSSKVTFPFLVNPNVLPPLIHGPL